MELVTTTRSHATATFSLQELETLNNALNEVCNGIDVPEFETRIGVKPEIAQALLKSISDALKRVETSPTGNAL
jgi:hypothetical protein